MELILREVVTKSQLREFIGLPPKIYAGNPLWVPPLSADEGNFHDPARNTALASSEVIRIIAWRGHLPVGRIMGIVYRKYNEQRGERTARFFNLDCVDEQPVAHALLEYIEQWARRQNMTKVIGPYGFSDKDPQGLQIEGHEHLAVIAAPSHPAYLHKLVEAEGYGKELDCVSYQLKVTPVLPPVYEKIYQRILGNTSIRLIEFTSKRKLKPYIQPVFRLVNETYAPLFGFVPMSEEEIEKFADQYIGVLDPAFVKLVVDEQDHPVAFVVAMPDMNPGMQRSGGKLFPFGFLHVLRSMKKTKQLNLLLGAVHPRFRGKGITVMLAKSLFQTAARRGLEVIDSHLILETNDLMRAECENIGGRLYKRFRVYERSL